MRQALALFAAFFAGMLLSYRLTAPQLDYWRAEVNEYTYQNDLLNRRLVAAEAAVQAAINAMQRAERACRTPMSKGQTAPMIITRYSIGCDAPGPYTKAGTTPQAGFTVAADPRVLPLGSRVLIEGLGERHVHDVGGLVKGRQLDEYVEDCAEAKGWDNRPRMVQVLHVGGTR